MIHRLYSTDRRFKTLKFRPGLNVLLADKAATAKSTDTRNGAGKTSVIELVHFVLGGDWDRSTDPEIIEDSFGLEIELGGQLVNVRRSGSSRGRVFFSEPLDSTKWPLQPERRPEGLSIRVEDWNALLGQFCFQLPVEHHEEKFRPKFRGLFSYFARRVKVGGFLHPQAIHQQQKLWDQQVAVTYLLGLDWTIPRDMERIRAKERIRHGLRKLLAEEEAAAAAAADPDSALRTRLFLGEALPDSAVLRTRLTLGEKRASTLRRSLSEFQVVDEYHTLETEADEITKELNQLSDQNTIDKQIVSDLERALSLEAPPDSADLRVVYEEAGLLLPPDILRRFDEVRAFHESVIRNRQVFLDAEIRSARVRINEHERRQRERHERRAQILGILQTSGALESFTELQTEYARVQAAVEHVRRQHEHALEFENVGREVVIERSQLEARLAINQLEQAEQIQRAVLNFGEISKRLYTKPGRLIVSRALTGPPIKIQIPRLDSEGVSSMQIFCFDVTMAQLMIERQSGPGFLIHDSHLFDGVDARQISRALRIAEEICQDLGIQYITMLNTDIAHEVASEGFDIDRVAMATVLSDQEGGGLFGRPFGAAS